MLVISVCASDYHVSLQGKTILLCTREVMFPVGYQSLSCNSIVVEIEDILLQCNNLSSTP